MDELREDSILFSLKGLLERERQRVVDEVELERRRIEAEQLQRLERERLGLEERERRRQEQEAQATREQQRRKEAAARLEALRHAEVARARAEVDAKARLELDARRREHELELQGIRDRGGRRRAEQLAMSFAAIALVAVAAAVSGYVWKVKPEQERARTGYERLLFGERQQSERVQRLLEESELRNTDLAASLAQTRQKLTEALSWQPRPASAVKRTAPPPKTPIHSPAGPRPRKACGDSRDPLDGCLP